MDGPVLELGDLFGGREIAQLDVNAGMSPGKPSDDLRPVEEVGPERTAHDELPDLSTIRPSHGSGCLLGVRDDGSGFGEEHSTGIRQLDATCRPVEEGCLQFGLETPNLLAQRRLRYMELRRGPPGVELLRHREEIPQMTQLHDGPNSYHRPLNRAGKIYWTVGFRDCIVAPTPRCRSTKLDEEDHEASRCARRRTGRSPRQPRHGGCRSDGMGPS